MTFSQLRNPKSPFWHSLSINFNRDICPTSMMKFHSVQTISQPTTCCFDICFFETPIPITTIIS